MEGEKIKVSFRKHYSEVARDMKALVLWNHNDFYAMWKLY